MGIYRLCDGYELKGWRNLPYALVNAEKHLVQRMSISPFLFLLSCDGISEVEEIPETAGFLEQGIIQQLDEPLAEQAALSSYELSDGFYRPKAQLAITGRCNFHCRHCLAADGDKNVSTQLTLQECEHVFDELAKNDIFDLWITGGEPLIHPDFREIFQSAVEHGLRVTSVFTNAWLLDADLLNFLEDLGQRPRFVVSFDGIGTHDWMRDHAGAEQRTLEKITLLHDHGFPVHIGLNVNSVTAPGVIETCRTLVKDYHVDALRPIYTSPTPRWSTVLLGGIEPLLPGDYYDLMIELLRTARLEEWGVDLNIIHMPALHRHPKKQSAWDLLRTPPEPLPKRTLMSSCTRASEVLFIGSDGRVLPCSTYEGESTKLQLFQGDDTNVLKTSLEEILTSSEYTREFETTIADLGKTDPECVGCRWVTICCGGCPLYTWARQYGEEGNPICLLYKGGYATKYLDMLEETDAIVKARRAACDKGQGCADG